MKKIVILIIFLTITFLIKPDFSFGIAGIPVFPEASPVSRDGIVLDIYGNPASNSVFPGPKEYEQGPKQSRPLLVGEIKDIKKRHNIVWITATTDGFSPNEFKVEPGELVNLLFSSFDKTHVFKFESIVLQAIGVGVSGKENRGLSFNAPEEKGIYIFYCDIPGHRNRGEFGKMYVGMDIEEKDETDIYPTSLIEEENSDKSVGLKDISLETKKLELAEIEIIAPKLMNKNTPNISSEILDKERGKIEEGLFEDIGQPFGDGAKILEKQTEIKTEQLEETQVPQTFVARIISWFQRLISVFIR